MATADQVKKAIVAVRKGLATEEQQKWAAAAAKQAGDVGNAARAAFRGRS